MKLWEMKPGVIIGTVGVLLGMILVLTQSRASGVRDNGQQIAKLRIPNAVNSVSNTDDYTAVEPNMHEFMEYMFEPCYKRLKDSMANESPDRVTWKAIKGDTLVLAEGTNLLMFRVPDEDPELWQENALSVREHGKALYDAAKVGDRVKAVASYRAMIENCNHCHDSHAEGKHQLDF